MPDDIPVQFQFNGDEVKGILSSVMGAGSTTVYHLEVDHFYWGRLRKANDQWAFDPTPKTAELKEMAEYFGNAVESVMKSHQ
jgi:hypothetical protein